MSKKHVLEEAWEAKEAALLGELYDIVNVYAVERFGQDAFDKADFPSFVFCDVTWYPCISVNGDVRCSEDPPVPPENGDWRKIYEASADNA